MVFWRIGLGARESIMWTAIAELIPWERRGAGYEVFNLFFGTFWFLGSAFMGVLCDFGILSLVGFSALLQLLAIPVFLSVRKPASPKELCTN